MSYQFIQYIPPRSSYQTRRPVKQRSVDTKLVQTITASSSSVSSTLSVAVPLHKPSLPAPAPPPPPPSATHYPNHSSPITGSPSRPRPIPNSYWATPQLLACEYPFTPANPSRPKLDTILLSGVRTFIDLTEDGELVPYSDLLSLRCSLLGIDATQVEYHRFPIRDRGLPESIDLMYAVLDTLRDNAARGRISAVHCRGGIGRTGMVIGCWLVECGIAKDGAVALEIIAKEWKGVEKCTRYPNSPETGAQFDFVYRFCPKVGKKIGMKPLGCFGEA